MKDKKPPNKAGQGRKPSKKRTSFYVQVFFTEKDYNRMNELKQKTGRSLQDIGNTAILEYVDKFGASNATS